MQDKDIVNGIKGKIFGTTSAQSVWERMSESVSEEDVERLKDKKPNVFVEHADRPVEEENESINKED